MSASEWWWRLVGVQHITVLKAALAEARSPAGKGNAQATEMVVALAEKMANAALAAMHDSKRAIADKLTSQVYLVGVQHIPCAVASCCLLWCLAVWPVRGCG